MSPVHRINRHPAPVHSAVSLELIDEASACRILGGSRPISKHTLYRGIAAGRFPRGVRMGPNTVRYVRAEIEAVVQAAIAERRAPAGLVPNPVQTGGVS
jgi:predicted DNA-binding transcriptional regulator AlpA